MMRIYSIQGKKSSEARCQNMYLVTHKISLPQSEQQALQEDLKNYFKVRSISGASAENVA